MIVYHSYDDYQQDISWFEYLTKKKFFSHEVCWKDPHWKALPARFLAGLMRATPEVSRSYVADKRQEFLLEDSQDTIPYQDVETEEPIITEDEVEHLNSNGSDDTQPYDSELVQFEGDYFVNLGHNSAAPDFMSYDINGFRQFCQYLAKNGKKTPKAESVITPQVLQKYAKQIKQAKLEEFRSFLDFTAMKFRDRRKQKIENFVTGRWVLTIKTDKDG